MLETVPSVDINRLKTLVRKHDVYFQVWPEFLASNGNKIRVGVEVDLCGAIDTAEPHFCPGCPRCEQTYSDLREIAEWVQPDPVEGAITQILAFDHAIHLGRGSRARPEVILVIHISNLHGFDGGPDPSQDRYVHNLRGRLATIGIVAH